MTSELNLMQLHKVIDCVVYTYAIPSALARTIHAEIDRMHDRIVNDVKKELLSSGIGRPSDNGGKPYRFDENSPAAVSFFSEETSLG